jgi:uncharacterized hydrophobic protein (TIGR00271 family)
VVADSTATVIGAMIVAPLMTPILGAGFALVLADQRRMLRSLGFVVGGALLVVAVAYVFGVLDPVPVVAATNSQVAARVSPQVIDLIAALATGLVGAFALVREDVSDTLPGVAIAISLVPPLAVVGLTLEGGAPDEALGALLLFATNVTAIIATCTILLLLYRVRDAAAGTDVTVGRLRGSTLALVGVLLLAVAVPLAVGTLRALLDQVVTLQASPIAQEWADEQGWFLSRVDTTGGVLEVTAVGPPPEANPEELRAALDEAGFEAVDLQLRLVIGGEVLLEGTG